MRRLAEILFVSFLLAAAPVTAQLSDLDIKPPEIRAASYILVDQATGETIAQRNADEKYAPASLVKLMTAYLVFSALEEERLTLSQKVPISAEAWRTGGSRMFIEPGEQVTVRQLLLGLIVQSGNDAAVALAEALAGTEANFVDLMNQQALLLGMDNTRFGTANGLPADNQYTTARDLAVLARRTILDFPELYSMYSIPSFSYQGITQKNRNRLLYRYPGADGLKTGYTKAAGYGLVSSAERDGMRLISVVMKTPSPKVRVAGSMQLLNFGFTNYKSMAFFEKSNEIKMLRVWGGVANEVPAGLEEPPLRLLVPRGVSRHLEAKIVVKDGSLHAPIRAGDLLGEIQVLAKGEIVEVHSLVALSDVAKGGWFKRATDFVRLNVLGAKAQ